MGEGVGPNEGVTDEDVGMLDGMEEREGVGEVLGRGKGAELNELALSEEGIVETRFDDEGVDLFEGSDVGAIGEETEIRVVLEKVVGRIRGGGEKVENGRGH